MNIISNPNRDRAKIRKCRECGEIKRHKAKGLCHACYSRIRSRIRRMSRTPEQREKANADKRDCYRRNRKKRLEYRKKEKEKFPWKYTLKSIQGRCRKVGHYGAKGIKNYLTSDDLKQLWFRDKAYKMKIP